MNTKHEIDNLWRELRRFIDLTYSNRPDPEDDNDADCLRDYVENRGWHDDLAELLGRETANERQHRRTRPSTPGFSCETASKLILMNNIVKGARMVEMPKATAFLVFRQTAVEAEVVGWLIKSQIDPNWITAVESYDYAKLMAA